MSLRRLWVPTVLAAGAGLAAFAFRRRLTDMLHNWHRYSAPNTALYDAVTAPVLAPFFSRVARELVELAPHGRILEVGSGPGRLSARLAELSPEIKVTGVDITPEMAEMATSLAARHSMAERLTFCVADVAALPFADSSFDAIVSTLSLHHWQKRAEGIAEIHRVLRPGGVARLYDLVDWITRLERHGVHVPALIGRSPFGGRLNWECSIAVSLGPVPIVYRLDLGRD